MYCCAWCQHFRNTEKEGSDGYCFIDGTEVRLEDVCDEFEIQKAKEVKRGSKITNECPFCNGEIAIQTSEFDGFEYVRNIKCNRCYGVFREVYRMKLDSVNTLIKPTRRADDE